MDAFAAAVDVLFADPHLSLDALWRTGGSGPSTPVRIMIRRPDAIVSFGEARALMATVLIEVRTSEVSTPQVDDTFEIGARLYQVIAAPRADALNLIWTCEVKRGALRIAAALVGDLRKVMAEEAKAAERAVTQAMREATDGLKTELRSQVTSAGLGLRLARTWRGEIYPKGQSSIAAAGFVWSKAPGIIRAYEDGAIIRSARGFFLAIPTQAAGKYGDGRAKITPGGWERRTGLRLRFVYRRGVPSLLVADLRTRTGRSGGFATPSATSLRTGRGLATVPIFILVPQVRIKKRLDVEAAARRWQGQLPQLIARHWNARP